MSKPAHTSTISEYTPRDIYLRLLRYVLPYKGVFAIAVAGMLVVAAGETAFVALLKPIMDDGFINRDAQLIKWLPLLLVIVLLVRGIGHFIDTYCMDWVGRKVIFDLRGQLFNKQLHLPEQHFDHNPSAGMVSQIIYDCEQVSTASTIALRVFIRDSVNIILLLIWMTYLSWKATLGFLLIVPAALLVLRIASKRLRSSSSEIQATMSSITQVATEALSGHELVKSFIGYDHQNALFQRANNRNRQHFMKRSLVTAISVPLTIFLAGIALAVIIWVALSGEGPSEVTAGTFISYISATVMLMQPLRRLTKINETIQTGIAAAQSIFKTIDLNNEVDDSAAQFTSPISGEIAFDDVCFSYDNQKTAIQSVSFQLPAQSKIALVGLSGSGKSTIAKLLLRLYQPTKGKITIDSQDISQLSLQALRSQISLVPQTSVLFNDTLRDNIIYGSEDKGDEHFEKVAKAALIEEFANRHPEGYGQLIGENGAKLSGGQQQRVAIARALYKNAPILLLDEATSALDSQSEEKIQTALDALFSNRTSLIIAHRLSTITNADLILVFEQGQLVEQGSHAQLIEADGAYADLVKIQHKSTKPKP